MTPTTAIEVEMMMASYRQHIESFRNKLVETFFVPLTTMFIKHIYIQRPHTDDMMQMCQDLGIDTPDFQPISFDGLTFRWRRWPLRLP